MAISLDERMVRAWLRRAGAQVSVCLSIWWSSLVIWARSKPMSFASTKAIPRFKIIDKVW